MIQATFFQVQMLQPVHLGSSLNAGRPQRPPGPWTWLSAQQDVLQLIKVFAKIFQIFRKYLT